jgi:murein DD-endopeptidase MepM/ murein hydrolase activator NlpD
MEKNECSKINRLGGRPHEAKRRRRVKIYFLGMIFAGLLVAISFRMFASHSPLSPLPPPQSSSQLCQRPQFHTIEGEVRDHSTILQSLSEKNIPPDWRDLIVSKLKPFVNFRKIREGAFHFITDDKGQLVKFVYEVSPTEIYEIEKEDQEYVARRMNILLQTRRVRVNGEIHSSLFDAMEEDGEEDSLTIAFADILAWEIDFYKDVREGDRFKVVVEKTYKGDQFIEYGKVLAVEYQRGDKIIRGIRYQDGYYNEKGLSLKKTFLKAPLKFRRISSKFSYARKHPILGGTHPHLGIDYAAPPGTPIWAVADGIVNDCGWNDGFGNQVVLRHMNGYKTYYGHLSRFGSGIRKGVKVRQQQIIGYVGSTGLSTGPHLDYRLTKDSQFRNPLKEIFPTGFPIGNKEREAFEQIKDEMLVCLEGNPSNPKAETGRIKE